MAEEAETLAPVQTATKPKTDTTLFWLGTMTFAWFLSVAVLLALTAESWRAFECQPSGGWCWWQKTAETIAMKSANEIGDLLAGVFAPVAFLWLAGTVFIQSNELRLQREELAETRAVLMQQQIASEATAEYLWVQAKATVNKYNSELPVYVRKAGGDLQVPDRVSSSKTKSNKD